MFSLRFVCDHLINVSNCCYGRCYGKSHILLIRFLKFHCFNAGNRVRLFQDSIPKCLKVTIVPFKKKRLLQPNITLRVRRRTLHVPNLIQMNKNYCFCLLTGRRHDGDRRFIKWTRFLVKASWLNIRRKCCKACGTGSQERYCLIQDACAC